MANQLALSAKIDQVAATLVAEIEQIKAALEAKVPPEIDLSPEIARLDALNTAIAGIIPDAPPADESLDPGFEIIEDPSDDPTAE
jgi:hypothetical protein